MADILIRGGTIVDGTGAPRYAADVRVSGGTIAEIGSGLATRGGEQVVDATGCYVTPGFIESHTHYDATMWWQPDLDPLPGNGATTVILRQLRLHRRTALQGEGGAAGDDQDLLLLRGYPAQALPRAMCRGIGRHGPNIKASMAKNVKLPTNYAAFVGHIALRLATMGIEAWERAATPAEIARMAELLEDALAAGALGLSDNLHDHDGDNRPIPTLLAGRCRVRGAVRS